MAKTNKKNDPNKCRKCGGPVKPGKLFCDACLKPARLDPPTVGGIPREKVILAAGYLMGLSLRPDPVLDAADREMIKNASEALRGACTTLWPEWFKD